VGLRFLSPIAAQIRLKITRQAEAMINASKISRAKKDIFEK